MKNFLKILFTISVLFFTFSPFWGLVESLIKNFKTLTIFEIIVFLVFLLYIFLVYKGFSFVIEGIYIKKFSKILIGLLFFVIPALLFIFVQISMHTYSEPSPDEFQRVPSIPRNSVEKFNNPITINLGEIITFPDGLTMNLYNINDSRCKGGQECFWQGELIAQFSVGKGKFGSTEETVELNSNNREGVSRKGYTFILQKVSENGELTVSVKDN